MIIFEIGYQKYEMPSEEQAMKAFEVFKGAKLIEHIHNSEINGVRYQRKSDAPEISVAMVPNEQLLENNEDKKPEDSAA